MKVIDVAHNSQNAPRKDLQYKLKRNERTAALRAGSQSQKGSLAGWNASVN